MTSLAKAVCFGIGMSLAAWAVASEVQAFDGSAPADETQHSGSQRLSPDAQIVYQILAGELAGKRGQAALALEFYLAAAISSDDPRVAERAVGIALFVENHAAMLTGARRWYALAPDSPQAQQALVLGLLRNNQVDEAIQEIDRVREAAAARDGQDGYATIGALLNEVEDKEVGYRVMDVLRERYPKSPFALYYYAVAAADLEKYDAALESVGRVLEMDPDWPQAHLLRARILVKQEQVEEALADLQEAVAKRPRDPALRAGYARLLISAERPEDAQREFETLAEQRPDDPEPLFALGLLAAQSQDYDTALARYKEVLSLGGRAMEVHYELGKIEELRGNYGEARDWYARVSVGPRFLDAQVRRGVVLGRLQDFQAMAALFERLRGDYPNRAVQLYLAQADVLRREHRSFESFSLLSRALEENPGNEELLYARALSAEKIDRLDILEQDLTALIEADPNNGQALNALGYTLADRTDRYQEALGLIERAFALLPNDAAVLDSMGWIKYRLGEFEQSLDLLRRAYALNGDAEIAAHLSEVLWVTGQQDEARQVWTRAIEQNPGNPYLLAVKERFGL